jgi:hypothetical protein
VGRGVSTIGAGVSVASMGISVSVQATMMRLSSKSHHQRRNLNVCMIMNSFCQQSAHSCLIDDTENFNALDK